MPPKKKFKHEGRDVEGESLTFQTKGEQWNVYELEDGSAVKIKVILMDVVRLLGEYNPSGEPIYLISAQQVVGVNANPELKKKAN